MTNNECTIWMCVLTMRRGFPNICNGFGCMAVEKTAGILNYWWCFFLFFSIFSRCSTLSLSNNIFTCISQLNRTDISHSFFFFVSFIFIYIRKRTLSLCLLLIMTHVVFLSMGSHSQLFGIKFPLIKEINFFRSVRCQNNVEFFNVFMQLISNINGW